MTKQLTKTEAAVLAMLTENTGSHPLDSGRIHGYSYNTNATIMDKPRAWVEDHSVTINVFYHLTQSLVHDDEIQKSFNEYVGKNDLDGTKSWASLLEGWCKLHGHTYRSGELTYNHETLLSSGYMWYELVVDGFDMVCIRSHNGCDARGGYSSPWFFNANGYDFAEFYSFNVAILSCTCGMSLMNDSYKLWRDREDVARIPVEGPKGSLLCPLCNNKLEADLSI